MGRNVFTKTSKVITLFECYLIVVKKYFKAIYIVFLRLCLQKVKKGLQKLPK